jgi:hypothetical protein
MAYTSLQLAQLACTKLGVPKITAFSDAGSLATHIKDLFLIEFRNLLKSNDNWHWAMKYAELAEDTELTHYTEWENAYDPPTDMLKLVDILNEQGLTITWQLQDAHIFVNYDAYTDTDGNVYPRAVFIYDAVTGTGDSIALQTGMGAVMTDEWAQAFASRLAWKLAVPVTKDRVKAADLRNEYLFVDLIEAQRINALATPGYGEPEDDWADTPIG